MELSRKLISVILVALIIIVPVSAYIYIFHGPSRLESVTIEAVDFDIEKRDGVRILATTEGSGQDFEGNMDLQVYFENERIHTTKLPFIDGLANHKLFLEDFCVGNGQYEFRVIHEDLRDRYDLEMDAVAEELGVVSTQAYNIQNSGFQPWQALYSYNVVFTTGWHYFTYEIERDEFASYDLGFQFKDTSAPLKVRGGDDGCTVEVWFTNPGGAQSRKHTFNVASGSDLDTTIEFTANGSYLYKYVNEMTSTIEIQAYENRPVDVPTGGNLIITQDLGAGKVGEDTQPITDMEKVTGYARPDYGPGNYTMTIDYPNPQIREGHALSTISFTEVIELNDKPRAIGRADPAQISTLQRTVTFSAVDSFDDGPKADLYVYWSFGSNTEGEIGSDEGPWEDMKEVTFTYPFGEDPDVTDGKPFLILKDAYGAVSDTVYINLAVS